MRNPTRLQFNAYAEQIATLNGVPNATVTFSVEPSIQQTLEAKIQEQSDFLSRINVSPVFEQRGQKLALGIGAPVASTTDTALKERETRDPTTLDSSEYFCAQTNFDTHLSYQRLDAWARFRHFQTLVRDAIVRQHARDRLMIGFNGTQRAATSDLAQNPLLQDVNVGWLQSYRTHAPQRVLGKGANGTSIRIGSGGDFRNLDALVFDARGGLIDPWYRNDTQLVAICSSDLLDDKLFPLINNVDAPSEKNAADLIISAKRLGGLQAAQVPFFPANSIFITRYDNLSLYWQEGARRRTILDNPKRDRIENFESSNDAYVVEDFGCGCLIENIEVLPAEGA